jgi:hypothetical protein
MKAAFPSRAVRLAFIFSALSILPAHAEMLEFAAPDGMKAWPKLPAVAGWHQDQAASFQFAANALIPDGVTFADADATILARGIVRGGKSLSQLMVADSTADPDGVQAEKAIQIADKDGHPFTIIAFTPGKSGKWEARAYAEEGRYYLVFTLSARSKEAYDQVLPVFSQMLQSYAEMIPW